MTHTKKFNKILESLSPEDMDTIRGYVLDTVRAEFGPLITSLSELTYVSPTPQIHSDSRDFSKHLRKPTSHEADEVEDHIHSDVPTRTYELEVVAREGEYVTYGNYGGLRLRVDRAEFEAAGSPNRIKIVASVA